MVIKLIINFGINSKIVMHSPYQEIYIERSLNTYKNPDYSIINILLCLLSFFYVNTKYQTRIRFISRRLFQPCGKNVIYNFFFFEYDVILPWITVNIV